MYLSRVELDLERRSTMIMLTAPQKMHGTIEKCFGMERRRRLWRLDKLGGNLYLLLLSEEKPDLTCVVEQFGTGRDPETKDYEPLLGRIQSGSLWRFRLTANPTKSCIKDETEGAKKIPLKRGKVRACSTVKEQMKWLRERGEKHGFLLAEDGFNVVHSQWIRFQKGESSRTVTLMSVTYEGYLQVTDEEKFRRLLTEGIGRGKAYGLGLMTIMRAENVHG